MPHMLDLLTGSEYYDHHQLFDEQIAADLVEYDRRRAATLDSPMRKRLGKDRVAA